MQFHGKILYCLSVKTITIVAEHHNFDEKSTGKNKADFSLVILVFARFSCQKLSDQWTDKYQVSRIRCTQKHLNSLLEQSLCANSCHCYYVFVYAAVSSMQLTTAQPQQLSCTSAVATANVTTAVAGEPCLLFIIFTSLIVCLQVSGWFPCNNVVKYSVTV